MGNSGMITGAFSSDTTISTPVAINKGGTGQTTAQAAIDALTAVSGASTNEVLTKDGSGNAAWAAVSASGRLEQIATHEATGTESSHTFSFSPDIDLDDYDSLWLSFSGVIVAALNIELVLDAVTGTTYHYNYTEDDSGTLTNTNGTNQNQFVIADSSILPAAQYFDGIVHILPMEQNEGADIYAISSIVHGFQQGVSICGGYLSGVGLSTLSSIKIETSTSSWYEHTRFNLMGLKKA